MNERRKSARVRLLASFMGLAALLAAAGATRAAPPPGGPVVSRVCRVVQQTVAPYGVRVTCPAPG